MKGLRIPTSLCIRCKGYKRLCGLPRCPILESFHARATAVARIEDGNVAGSSPPSIIVGEKNYPHVPILYGIPPGVYGDEAKKYGDVKLWFTRGFTLTTILRLRSQTIHVVKRHDVRDPMKLYETEVSLAAVSEKPVDSEAKLKTLPALRLSFSDIVEPAGPTAPARTLRVTGNPRLPRRLEKLLWDDVDARTAILELYRDTGDVYAPIAALSMGLLGRIRNRRLVPTRWAITAVDSIVGDNLLRMVKEGDIIDDVEVYHHTYLGNKFTIILLPRPYEAEMVELWHPYTIWTRGSSSIEYYFIREDSLGRYTDIDGGYLAARLAVLEHLASRRRQAGVVIVREVTRDYYAPVGNWHIRETVRRALQGRPFKPQSFKELLEFITTKHPYAQNIIRFSKLLFKPTQRLLDEYFTHS